MARRNTMIEHKVRYETLGDRKGVDQCVDQCVVFVCLQAQTKKMKKKKNKTVASWLSLSLWLTLFCVCVLKNFLVGTKFFITKVKRDSTMQALDEFLTELNDNLPSLYFQETTSLQDVKQWIQDKIKESDIVIFSKTDCKFCQRAIRLCETFFSFLNVQFSISILDLNKTDAPIVQPVLKEMTLQTTVPNIFFYGQHLGGYDSLMNHFHNMMTKQEIQ